MKMYSRRTINEWNKLSTYYCLGGSSMNMFKNKIDKYIYIKFISQKGGRLYIDESVGLLISQWLPYPLAI